MNVPDETLKENIAADVGDTLSRIAAWGAAWGPTSWSSIPRPSDFWRHEKTEDEKQGEELMAEFERQDAAQKTFDAYSTVRKHLLHNAQILEDEAKRWRTLAEDLPTVKRS